jgi:hypothetical protein
MSYTLSTEFFNALYTAALDDKSISPELLNLFAEVQQSLDTDEVSTVV